MCLSVRHCDYFCANVREMSDRVRYTRATHPDQYVVPDHYDLPDQIPHPDTCICEHDPRLIAVIWTKYPLQYQIVDGMSSVSIPPGDYDVTCDIKAHYMILRHVGHADECVVLFEWCSDKYVEIVEGTCPIDAPIVDLM